MEQDKSHQSESRKSVSVNFEWQIDRLLATQRCTDAFEVCLEEVKKNKNYSSINWKIDVVISKLKNKIHIPSFFTNINPSWLIDHLTAKGYSKLERKDGAVNWEKIAINISQINSQKHEIKTTSSLKPILKYPIIVSYSIILVYSLYKMFDTILWSIESYEWYRWEVKESHQAEIYGYGNHEDHIQHVNSSYADFIDSLKETIIPSIIVIGLVFLFIKFAIPYFKRKKKLIRDIAEICLEECER
ncbi:MAG: hypothetical protein IIX43_03870 [Bacteroidales bacterium]|nr:hypothetical protein [Bacteroidales bacterium]